MTMRLRSRQRGQTLIIIFLGMLLLGGASHALNEGLPGGSIKELRNQIKEVVKDPERKKALLAELDDWEKDSKGHSERYAAIVKDALEGFEKPDRTATDFEQAFSSADALNADIEQSFLNKRETLRGQLDAAEWRQIFASEEETAK